MKNTILGIFNLIVSAILFGLIIITDYFIDFPLVLAVLITLALPAVCLLIVGIRFLKKALKEQIKGIKTLGILCLIASAVMFGSIKLIDSDSTEYFRYFIPLISLGIFYLTTGILTLIKKSQGWGCAGGIVFIALVMACVILFFLLVRGYCEWA